MTIHDDPAGQARAILRALPRLPRRRGGGRKLQGLGTERAQLRDRACAQTLADVEAEFLSLRERLHRAAAGAAERPHRSAALADGALEEASRERRGHEAADAA